MGKMFEILDLWDCNALNCGYTANTWNLFESLKNENLNPCLKILITSAPVVESRSVSQFGREIRKIRSSHFIYLTIAKRLTISKLQPI